MVVGEKVANKVTKKRVAKKVAKKRVAEVAETWNRTSPSVTSVRKLENSPHVPGGHVVAAGGGPSLVRAMMDSSDSTVHYGFVVHGCCS